MRAVLRTPVHRAPVPTTGFIRTRGMPCGYPMPTPRSSKDRPPPCFLSDEESTRGEGHHHRHAMPWHAMLCHASGGVFANAYCIGSA